MGFIPMELKCTEKKPDGSPMYGVPRMMWNGKVHTWRSFADRTTFYKTVQKYVKDLTGKDVPLPTFVMSTALEMAQFLKEYPGSELADDAIIAELKELGEDVDALATAATDPDELPGG